VTQLLVSDCEIAIEHPPALPEELPDEVEAGAPVVIEEELEEEEEEEGAEQEEGETIWIVAGELEAMT